MGMLALTVTRVKEKNIHYSINKLKKQNTGENCLLLLFERRRRIRSRICRRMKRRHHNFCYKINNSRSRLIWFIFGEYMTSIFSFIGNFSCNKAEYTRRLISGDQGPPEHRKNDANPLYCNFHSFLSVSFLIKGPGTRNERCCHYFYP